MAKKQVFKKNIYILPKVLQFYTNVCKKNPIT